MHISKCISSDNTLYVHKTLFVAYFSSDISPGTSGLILIFVAKTRVGEFPDFRSTIFTPSFGFEFMVVSVSVFRL